MDSKKCLPKIFYCVLVELALIYVLMGCGRLIDVKAPTDPKIEEETALSTADDTVESIEVPTVEDTEFTSGEYSGDDVPQPPETAETTENIEETLPVGSTVEDEVYPEFFNEKSDFVNEMISGGIMLYSEKRGVEALFDKIPDWRSPEIHSKIMPVNPKPKVLPADYFRDVIILGDSVSLGFDLYRESVKVNGEKVFDGINVIAVISYGVYNATREVAETSVHPKIDGVKTPPADAIASYDATKIFISLGLNDVIWANANDFIKYYKLLTDNITEKNPDKEIYILSITPITQLAEKGNWTNKTINEFNDRLIEFASESGFEFLDFAYALRDENGFLPNDISSDGVCHLKPEAYRRIAEYLLYHMPD